MTISAALTHAYSGTRLNDRHALAARLVGRALPPVVLESCQGRPSHLQMLPVRAVLYFYPGCTGVLGDRANTDRLDAAQHRAFRDHKLDLDARDYRAIGISSQTSRLQGESVLIHDVPHLLLSDPELLVAEALELPTYEAYGTRWYERLTLVAGVGRVQKAFFPVATARSAAQVLAWMQIQGI